MIYLGLNVHEWPCDSATVDDQSRILGETKAGLVLMGQLLSEDHSRHDNSDVFPEEHNWKSQEDERGKGPFASPRSSLSIAESEH